MAVQVLVLKERAAGTPRGRDAGNGQETGRARCRRVDRAGAGRASSMHDAAYLQAGAQPACAGAMAQAEMVLCVQAPSTDTLLRCKPHTAVIGMRWRRTRIRRAQAFATRQLIAFPLERLPRTALAQSMDVLRSQAGMASDKAVRSAAQLAPRFFPMPITAAGTMRCAKCWRYGRCVDARPGR
ncbi:MULTISPECIES: hypothetical protein [Xanthomonas]|uniref:hypothetical protein n=1 Tax=Xanthomonas TaxID=338 RepID=UPI0035593232